MSVNVTSPVPEDFREAAITGSLSLFTIVNAGDYIIGYDQASPSKLVRFTKSNLATQSVFTFPADGKHIHATGIYYRASTGKAYVTFFNPGRLLISEVDITVTPMTSVDRVDRAITGMAPTWIDGDNTYLYVLSRDSGVGGELSKIALSDFTESTPLSLPTYFLGSAFCILGGKSYLVGTTELDGTDLTLLRINNTTLTIDGTSLFPPALVSSDMNVDISPSATEVWVSFRDVSASVYGFNSSLVMTAVATTATGDHTGFGFDGQFFWQLFSSGLSIRLNPFNPTDTRRYILATGYMTELISVSGFLYVLQTSGIARYDIPTDVTPPFVGITSPSGTLTGAFVCEAYATDNVAMNRVDFYLDGVFFGSATESPTSRFRLNAHANNITNGPHQFTCIGYDTSGNSSPVSFSDVIVSGANTAGQSVWAKTLVAGNQARANSIITDAVGNVIVVGEFYFGVDFGGGVRPGNGGASDIFIVKYDADGVYQWDRAFGVGGIDRATAVAVDSNGDVIVTGAFSGTVNLGGTDKVSTGAADIFLAKYAAADGTHLWSKSFGGPGNDSGFGLAVDSSGNIFMSGTFSGTDVGGVSVTWQGGFGGDLLVAKFDGADGTTLWAKTWGGTGTDSGNGISVNADGDAIVVGFFSGGTLGDGTVSGGAFVAKYSGVDGSYLWATVVNTGTPGASGVAIDAATGNIIVSGSYGINPPPNFGSGLISASTIGGFLAAYTDAGTFLWAQQQGNRGLSVAVKTGLVVFAGSVGTTPEVYFAKAFTITGSSAPVYRWQRSGSGASSTANGITIDASGFVLFCGIFKSTIDLGGRTLSTSDVLFNMFVTKNNP